MSLNPKPHFPVGAKFTPRGKTKELKVIDYLVTRNLEGEIVYTNYLCAHYRMGQRITSHHKETSIAMALGVPVGREGVSV